MSINKTDKADETKEWNLLDYFDVIIKAEEGDVIEVSKEDLRKLLLIARENIQ